LRGKHCSRCGVCIRKFDHHCILIGCCVGESNHFKFYIYTITQTITLYCAIYAIIDTISFYLDKTGETYSRVPIILYILLVILSLHALMATILVFHQHFVIITNQTTFEIFYKSCIPYLTKYKELKKQHLESLGMTVQYNTRYLPFDMGLMQNIKLFIANEKEIDWFKYLYENLKYDKKRFNCCDNEYYSCF
jgi:hypothetical protein